MKATLVREMQDLPIRRKVKRTEIRGGRQRPSSQQGAFTDQKDKGEIKLAKARVGSQKARFTDKAKKVISPVGQKIGEKGNLPTSFQNYKITDKAKGEGKGRF